MPVQSLTVLVFENNKDDMFMYVNVAYSINKCEISILYKCISNNMRAELIFHIEFDQCPINVHCSSSVFANN